MNAFDFLIMHWISMERTFVLLEVLLFFIQNTFSAIFIYSIFVHSTKLTFVHISAWRHSMRTFTSTNEHWWPNNIRNWRLLKLAAGNDSYCDDLLRSFASMQIFTGDKQTRSQFKGKIVESWMRMVNITEILKPIACSFIHSFKTNGSFNWTGIHKEIIVQK